MEDRRTVRRSARRTFSELARAALERHVPEARGGVAVWGEKPNLGWLSWRLPDGRYVFLALRRHLSWVTGEVGVSPVPSDLERLPLQAAPDETPDAAFRVRLGHLLHDEDKWWPAGSSEKELVERLEWLALQSRVRLNAFLRAPR
uniref:Uncharacterized protein n=1 Tax=Eiseniibacteriota bacterium TaxID=2212470 RepID=A0A832MNI5_UNCEI